MDLSPPLTRNSNYRGPGDYIHYKGGRYQVLGIGLREDTAPKPDNPDVEPIYYVIYRPLDSGSLLEQALGVRYWLRELSDFNDTVKFGPREVRRFESLR